MRSLHFLKQRQRFAKAFSASTSFILFAPGDYVEQMFAVLALPAATDIHARGGGSVSIGSSNDHTHIRREPAGFSADPDDFPPSKDAVLSRLDLATVDQKSHRLAHRGHKGAQFRDQITSFIKYESDFVSSQVNPYR